MDADINTSVDIITHGPSELYNLATYIMKFIGNQPAIPHANCTVFQIVGKYEYDNRVSFAT